MVKCVQTGAERGAVASAMSPCAKHAVLVKRCLLRQTFCLHHSSSCKAVSQAQTHIFHSYCIWFTSAEGSGNVQQWLWNLNRNPQGISTLKANFQIWEKRSSSSSLGRHPQLSKGQNSWKYVSFLEFVQKGNCCHVLVRVMEWNTNTVIAERSTVYVNCLGPKQQKCSYFFSILFLSM